MSVFDLSVLPPAHRHVAWPLAAARIIHPMTVSSTDGRPMRGRIESHDLGEMRVIRVGAPTSVVERPRTLIAPHEDSRLHLTLMLEGNLTAEQGESAVHASPGEAFWYRNSTPYRLHASADVRLAHVLLPARLTGVVSDVVGPAAEGTLTNETEIGRLVLPFVTALVTSRVGGTDMGPVGPVLVHLLATLGSRPGRSTGDEHLAAAQAHIERNLASPALSPASIAAACNISLRYVHAVFARNGLTIGGYVRGRRLSRSLALLTDPSSTHLPVGTIAEQLGFRSAAHFSREFRARYGTPPSSIRPRSRA